MLEQTEFEDRELAANPRLKSEIARCISHLGYFFVRGRALETLLAIGEPAVLPLVQALSHSDEDVRRCAAELLGKIGDERAVYPLCETLYDAEQEIRSAATAALVRIGEPAVPTLLETMKKRENVLGGVRRCVAPTLGKIGTPAIPALLEALKDQDASVRAGAISALVATRNAAVVLPLAAMLKDNNEWVRYEATGLGEFGDERAIPALCAALKDGYYMVRSNAARALGKIGGVHAILPLCEALKDRYTVVRSAADAALESIGDSQTLALTTLRSEDLTPIQKLDVLEALRNDRVGTGRLRFQNPLSSIPEYCRDLIEKSSDAAVREGARTVLAEIRRRDEKGSYLRASSPQTPSHELLRAAGEGDRTDPEMLVRASQSPEQQADSPK